MWAVMQTSLLRSLEASSAGMQGFEAAKAKGELTSRSKAATRTEFQTIVSLIARFNRAWGSVAVRAVT